MLTAFFLEKIEETKTTYLLSAQSPLNIQRGNMDQMHLAYIAFRSFSDFSFCLFLHNTKYCDNS